MNKPKTVFMFSGQGSQYFQMGQQLFGENAIFRNSMQEMDQLVRQSAGYSVLDSLYQPGRSKGDPFDQIHLSYPAIFMVEYALAKVLIEAGLQPELTMGASMGSFAAATVSGCITMPDALAMVVKHAQLFESYCENGSMIAILASPDVYQEAVLANHSVIAAHNYDNHFVVAAKHDKLAEIEDFLRARALTFQRLPVKYAFHSPWIELARSAAQDSLKDLPVSPARIPIACCVHAKPITELTEDYFWRTAREPIRFQALVNDLESSGHYHYIDVGPAGTLATFLKYLLPTGSASRATTILSPWGREQDRLAALLKPA